MIGQGITSRKLLRLACFLALLSILAALPIACNGPESVSDEAVISAAKSFAKAMKAAGRTAAQIVELASEEAQKWGPKAQLFIDTVLAELGL